MRPSALLASRSAKPLIQFQSKTNTRITSPTITSPRAMPIHFSTVRIFDLYTAHIVRDISHYERGQGWLQILGTCSTARHTCPALPRPVCLLPCLPGAGGCARGWLRASLPYPQTVVYGFDTLNLLGNLHGSLSLCGAGYGAS